MNKKNFKIKRIQGEESYLFGQTTRAWLNDGIIIYTTSGSSTTPPVLEKVEQIGNEIHLYTKDLTGLVGTSDLVPLVQFIEYSDGSKISPSTKIFLDGRQQN